MQSALHQWRIPAFQIPSRSSPVSVDEIIFKTSCCNLTPSYHKKKITCLQRKRVIIEETGDSVTDYVSHNAQRYNRPSRYSTLVKRAQQYYL